MSFSCSICEQESTRICARCTKDACVNHVCDRCGCCSDCCDCDVPLDEPPMYARVSGPPAIAPASPPAEEPQLPPDPDTVAPDEPSPDPFEPSRI